MEKVRLGRTNLIVTKLGWGGIPIQRVGEHEAVSVIRSVVEMGVDLLDTARAYTNSEHRIGLALQKINKPIVLSTKSTEKSDKIYDDVHESLKQLKVKKIDIYHLHNVSNFEEYEKVLATGGAYQGLKRAQEEGVIEEAGPALRFVLQTKEILPIPGSETLKKARENWKIFSERGSLTERDQERIEAIKKQFNKQF